MKSMILKSPLLIFLIMNVTYVVLSPGIVLNFPPLNNNWSDKDSYLVTGENKLINAVVHGMLYTCIMMAILGIFTPYSHFYGPSHMKARYSELYGPQAARAMSDQLDNLGNTPALAGMPGQQVNFLSRMHGTTMLPGMVGPHGVTDASGRPIRPGPGGCSSNYMGAMTPASPGVAPSSPIPGVAGPPPPFMPPPMGR